MLYHSSNLIDSSSDMVFQRICTVPQSNNAIANIWLAMDLIQVEILATSYSQNEHILDKKSIAGGSSRLQLN